LIKIKHFSQKRSARARIAIINHGKIAAIDSPERLRLRSSGLQSIEVSFDKGVGIEELSKFHGVNEAKKMGDKIRLYVDEQSAVIDKLLDFSRSKSARAQQTTLKSNDQSVTISASNDS
jgi:ABC-type multidrug transport system ATPase subunit